MRIFANAKKMIRMKITLLSMIVLALGLSSTASALAQDTITVQEYGREQHLREAGVSGKRRGTTKMWSSAENRELITTAGLRVAACCNLGESFVNSAAVDVNYSDAATGARQIRLLGLSGTYVQMLTENIPNFRIVAAPYGLSYVPGPWMHSIQVSKGITSVKQGYEAMSGQINVEYKKPQQQSPEQLHVEAYGNSRGGIEGNANATFILPSGWGTTLLAHYNRDLKAHDMNHDGFSDMPQVTQYSFMNRWHYQSRNYEFQVGAKYLDESRRGGQLTTGNGQLSAVNGPYQININSRRIEGFMKNAYMADCFHNCNVALILSGSYHDQESLFGMKRYDVAQTNLYGSLMYEGAWNHDRHKLSVGLSANYDGLSTHQHEMVVGAYAQYALNLGDHFLLQPGLRYDYSDKWGSFVTPRIHLKYSPNHHWNFRLSAGRGYRTSFALAENSYLLSGSRQVVLLDGEALRESNWNAGASVQFKPHVCEHVLDITAEYYYTNFDKQAVMNFDRDPHKVYIYQLQGRSFSQVAQLEVSYPFFTGFTATAAFRWNDVRCNYDGRLRQKPLTSRYKGLLTLEYTTPDHLWQFNATLQLNGPGRMPDPYTVGEGAEAVPSWQATYKAFPQLQAQISRQIHHWSLYVGGENLTNFRQKNPIIAANDPWGDRFDPTMVWGPVDGWMLYAGVRFNLPR